VIIFNLLIYKEIVSKKDAQSYWLSRAFASREKHLSKNIMGMCTEVAVKARGIP